MRHQITRLIAYSAYLCCFLLFMPIAVADKHSISIVYPEIQEPYRTIFSEIIKGVNDELHTNLASYAVPKKYEQNNIHNWIKRKNSKVVIALGQRGFRASHTITPPLSLVLGAVIAAPANDLTELITISYAPDPNKIFSHLKKLSPSIENVHVIYNPEKNKWLIELAKKRTTSHKLQLISYEASNFRDSAVLYKKILSSVNSSTDAIWLLQDASTLDEKVILPLILEESWRRKLIVFSSNLSHVNKGVLFALYPDNYNLGRRLGQVAKAVAINVYQDEKLQPLQDVRIAVNIRTAKHLGLNISYKRQREFDLIFPKN